MQLWPPRDPSVLLSDLSESDDDWDVVVDGKVKPFTLSLIWRASEHLKHAIPSSQGHRLRFSAAANHTLQWRNSV